MEDDPTLGDDSVPAEADADTEAGTGQTPSTRQRRSSPRLRSGERLGRYTVLELLGQGGMGLVYAAYDPQLDRRVAVKVLRTLGGAASERGRQRLMREAQAMAKLSHPNVVAVHDVGTVDDEIFVAMEFVDGPTLDRWLEQQERSPAQIVEIFAQAGRGLAAAHEAGMVHRDFKPANVLIDDRDRARVTDFGLVRTSAMPTEAPSSESDSPPSPLAAGLTDGGQLLGTPAYMAPEQHLGGEVDARSDQFGFCVALFEALFGAHPFAGETLLELMSAVSQGERRETPARRDVPAPIRRAVLRGLERDPADRWPDMPSLLDALLDDPGQRRRRRLAGAGGLLGVVGLLGMVALAARPEPTPEPVSPCAGAGDEVDRLWSQARRDEIAAAFVATGQGHASTLWSRASTVIDGYTERWRTSARDACEATRVRGEQSDSLFDLRRACLDRRLDELDTRLRVLSRIDESTIDHGFEMATGLTPIAVCEDRRRLEQPVPPPDDPEAARQVAEVQHQLTELRVELSAGRAAELVERAEALVERADAIDYPTLRAEARMIASDVHEALGHWDEAEALLRRAAVQAGEGRDDHLLASIWANMPYLVGYLQGRADDVELLRPVIDTALARAGHPAGPVQVHHQGLGATRLQQGDLEQARAHYLEALLLLGETDAASLGRAHLLNNLAVIRMQGGFFEEARDLFEQSQEARQGLLRLDHPDFADVHQNLATIAARQGDVRLSLEHIDQGLAIATAAQPDGGPQELALQLNRSAVSCQAGRLEDARAAIDRTTALAERLLGPEHPNWMVVWINRAQVERTEGHFDEARAWAERASTLAESMLGTDDPSLSTFILERGKVELEAGMPDRARPLIERALQLYDVEGTDRTSLAEMLRWRGEQHLRDGEVAEATASFERAIELLERHEGDRLELARARFGLARCLPAAERVRARGLAERARAQLQEDGIDRDVGTIDAWLGEGPAAP